MLSVLTDILSALDSGDLAMLTLLDLSAVFDSVGHDTLLKRLQKSYGLGGAVINWFTSYLAGRTQIVVSSASRSTPTSVLYGVPQGLVLGPILFLLFIADVLQLVKSHQLLPHAMHTLTIHRYVDPVGHQMSTSYRSISLTVSMRCHHG